MLNQEQKAFTKALSDPDALSEPEFSTVFIRALRKALAAAKMKKFPLANVASTLNTGREFPQLTACKRNAEELSSCGCSSEPASRLPADGNQLDLGPEAQDTTGELAATSSRQLGVSEGGLPYAEVVAGYAGPQHPSGTQKPPAMGLYHSEPEASSEAAQRRMSLGDVSGPLCGMPNDTTSNAHVVTNVVPAAERQNKTRIYVSGVEDKREFLSRIRASCPNGLTAPYKVEKLMPVPRTSEGFRATFSALRSRNVSEGETFHTFDFPEDPCVRMPEGIVKEELENLGIRVQAVLQLRPGRRGQKTSNAHPLTLHFIVSVARRPDVAKLRSLTEL